MRVAALALALVAVSSVASAPIPIHERRSNEVSNTHQPTTELHSRENEVEVVVDAAKGAGEAVGDATQRVEPVVLNTAPHVPAVPSDEALKALAKEKKKKTRRKIYRWAIGLPLGTVGGLIALTYLQKDNCQDSSTISSWCPPKWQTHLRDPPQNSGPTVPAAPAQFYPAQQVPGQPMMQANQPQYPMQPQQGGPSMAAAGAMYPGPAMG